VSVVSSIRIEDLLICKLLALYVLPICIAAHPYAYSAAQVSSYSFKGRGRLYQDAAAGRYALAGRDKLACEAALARSKVLHEALICPLEAFNHDLEALR
jgi:hypothetical protein